MFYNSLPGVTKSEDADCCLAEGLEQPPARSEFSRRLRPIDSLTLPLESCMGAGGAGQLAAGRVSRSLSNVDKH